MRRPFDGLDGRVAQYVHVREGVETRLSSKTTLDLEPGDVISVRTCGGGGYGHRDDRGENDADQQRYCGSDGHRLTGSHFDLR